jgi:hypothetical protein
VLFVVNARSHRTKTEVQGCDCAASKRLRVAQNGGSTLSTYIDVSVGARSTMTT